MKFSRPQYVLRFLQENEGLIKGDNYLSYPNQYYAFFGTGVMAAVFNAADTKPICRESLTMLRTRFTVKKLVWRGLSLQVVTFICDTSLISSSESI